MNTYWNGTGNYQKDYDELYKLVPISGASKVLAGELTRAATKIGYDFYNNGMSNNTSGALLLLLNYNVICGNTYLKLAPVCSKNKVYGGCYDGDETHWAIESMIDQTMLKIQDNPQWLTQDVLYDIFSMQQEQDYGYTYRK